MIRLLIGYIIGRRHAKAVERRMYQHYGVKFKAGIPELHTLPSMKGSIPPWN